mmetsp:Transcript_136082/g.322538  ORF Transcript_136082/g.322538 Transcript_136082/m.322538 type:complete len:256 (+) Transcript_136082:450-1217(+)
MLQKVVEPSPLRLEQGMLGRPPGPPLARSHRVQHAEQWHAAKPATASDTRGSLAGRKPSGPARDPSLWQSSSLRAIVAAILPPHSRLAWKGQVHAESSRHSAKPPRHSRGCQPAQCWARQVGEAEDPLARRMSGRQPRKAKYSSLPAMLRHTKPIWMQLLSEKSMPNRSGQQPAPATLASVDLVQREASRQPAAGPSPFFCPLGTLAGPVPLARKIVATSAQPRRSSHMTGCHPCDRTRHASVNLVRQSKLLKFS